MKVKVLDTYGHLEKGNIARVNGDSDWHLSCPFCGTVKSVDRYDLRVVKKGGIKFVTSKVTLWCNPCGGCHKKYDIKENRVTEK